MTADSVQFREDPKRIQYLRDLGVNPNEFGREAFRSALRRFQAERAMKKAGSVRARLPKALAELVREDRESH